MCEDLSNYITGAFTSHALGFRLSEKTMPAGSEAGYKMSWNSNNDVFDQWDGGFFIYAYQAKPRYGGNIIVAQAPKRTHHG
ncbi:hypothetical protein RRF57_007617 [Xylaria bambusicola]|uniref:Uncharacterized protein n=1 Tax=Xylaria bambusicola TaxID=326684 RepID=A0AAN7UN20_9PEZI